MPTYDYQCKNCGNTLEKFQGITDKPLKRCPRCRKMALKRKIGPGSGFIFRGEPFSASTEYLAKNKDKNK